MKSGADAHDHAGDAAAPPRADPAVYSKIKRLAGLGLLEAFSIGIIVPMIPIVTTEYFARHYTHGAPIDCGRDSRNVACIAGSKDADWWTSWIGAVGSICFFMISPSMGIASDIYGRKPFVVGSQFMRLGMPFTMIYFVEYGGLIWPYFFLRLICHIFETMGVTSAAVADSIGAENRATSFGFLFALSYIGFSVSAGLSGFFSRNQALRISAFLCIVRTLYAVFIFPETLPPEKRTRKNTHRARCKNPIKGMSILLRSQLFMRLTAMIAITTFVGAGNGQIRMFYLNTVIGFDEKDMSRLMLTFGIGSIVAQLVLLRPIMHCGKEKGVIVVAIVGRMLECGGFIVSTFIPKKWVIYATIVPSSLGDLSFAAISSLKSINCSDEEQGRLQGAIYSARAVFEAAGPVVFAFIYNTMQRDVWWTQVLPFAISIVLYGCGAVVAMFLPISDAQARPPMPFSPVSSTASTPTGLTSASGTIVLDYSDEDVGDEENAYLAEPLLGSYDRTKGRGGSEV